VLEALIGLIILGTLIAFWQSALRARESATSECRRYCRSHELQFLDETVAMSHFEVTRRPSGLVTLRRVYAFEFSEGGVERKAGSITMIGDRVESVYMPLFNDP
jgi:hypothetical protein